MTDKMELVGGAADAFRRQFTREPELIVVAPGRANLIGEHTDYNEGHCLPVAINLYMAVAAAGRTDRVFRLHTANLDESFDYEADRLPEERPTWVSYMMGVIAELERDGFEFSGKDIAVFGNVPIGSGLSSSAALEVATATAIERLEGLEADDVQIVNACRRADHNFVGINSGPLDQFSSRVCKAGYAGLLDCRALTLENKKLPDGIEFLSVRWPTASTTRGRVHASGLLSCFAVSTRRSML